MQYYAKMDIAPIVPIARKAEGREFESFNRRTREWEDDFRTGSEVRFSGDWNTISEEDAELQAAL